jgi:uncharacterized membrane protein
MGLLRPGTARILTFAAFGVCSLVDHAVLMTGTPLASILAFAQLSLIGVLFLWSVPHRYKWLAAVALCIVAGAFYWRSVQPSLVAASALPHTLAYLGLLMVFGSSLLPGREALVTALARHMHPPISQEMAAYTRKLTWAWTAFFAAQLGISLLLYVLATVAAWSFFVNVLNLPLLVSMFVAEYIIRGFVLIDPPRHGLAYMTGMAAFIKEKLSKPASTG